MRIAARRLDCLSEGEIRAIVEYALAILERVGLRLENPLMCRHLAEHGAAFDGQSQVRFPRRLMEQYLASQRRSADQPRAIINEARITGSVGGYPLRWVDPRDGQVKAQTLRSVIDLTRLADALPNIASIGTTGVPSDIPPLLAPLYARLVGWRHAQRKPSNSYMIWDTRLCPHILELCQLAAECEGQPINRFLRASNYFVSPLRYPREEAAQFAWFWQHGQRLTIGNLPTIGGTAPATIAGAVGLGLAESIAIAFIHHAFHGDRGLHLTTTFAPLDMRSGYMPYGRPEQILAELAISQIAEYLGAEDTGSAGRQTGAKGPDVEAGLNKALSAGVELALLGQVSFSMGKYSTDEVIDPRLMVIEDEFLDSVRRLARGFEVTGETLPLDVVAQAVPRGQFLDQEHTVEHWRKEIWMPRLFSGVSFEAWRGSGGQDILEKARQAALDILGAHHPRGIKPATQERLLASIRASAANLGLDPSALPDVEA